MQKIQKKNFYKYKKNKIKNNMKNINKKKYI